MGLNGCGGGNGNASDAPVAETKKSPVETAEVSGSVDVIPGKDNNSAPVAYAGKDFKAEIGDSVELTAALIPDKDGDKLVYIWSITDKPMGSQTELSVQYSTGRKTSFILDEFGNYTVALLVRNEEGATGADTITISTELHAHNFQMISSEDDVNWKVRSDVNNQNAEAQYVNGSCDYGYLEVAGAIVTYSYNSDANESRIDTGCKLNIFDDADSINIELTVYPNTWKQVSAGYDHTLAVKYDGSLWAWGGNDEGQLGLGYIFSDKLVPTQVGDETDWDHVSAGRYYSMAVKTDRTLWTWGNNNYGKLGLGQNVYGQLVPTKVGSETNWEDISAGYYHSMAVKTDGTLWTWGRNDFWQLGRVVSGGSSWSGVPAMVGNDTNWSKVSAGNYHSTAIKTNGTLWTWGRNNFMQLGLGNITDTKPVPTRVGNAEDWKKVSAGSWHTLAIKTGGTLWAWGANQYGQLGRGYAGGNPSGVPTMVAGNLTTWNNVDAGGWHTLATKTDGTLWSWGYNGSGELGLDDDQSNWQAWPTQVNSVPRWNHISAGEHHSMGIRKDSTLWSWGRNDSGQLGLGDTDTRFEPIKVTEH